MTLLRRVIVPRCGAPAGSRAGPCGTSPRPPGCPCSTCPRSSAGRKEASSEILAAICAAFGWSLIDLMDELRADLAVLDVAEVTTPGQVRLAA
jgi:hypothetical protein